MYNNALSEIFEILKYVNTEKIPKKLMKYIEDNKSENYIFHINKKLPIEKQKILPETEAIITILYRDYICTDEEKNEIKRIINENDKRLQKI